MTIKGLAAAISLALGATTSAQGQAQTTLEERVLRLEQENRTQAASIERQRQTIEQQKQRLEGAPMRVKRLEESIEREHEDGAGGGDGWFEHVEIAGLIEIEGVYADPFEGDSESDIVLATVELGIASQINDWVAAQVSLLYEEDDTDLEVDIAQISIANPEVTPVFFNAGQFYVPFGAYETNLVSDPLTLEIGESRETAAQLGFVYQGFSGSVYGFNGDNQVKGKSQIDSWGANLGFAQELEQVTWTIGVGYLNDLGDSDSLQDRVSDNRNSRYAELIEGEDADAGRFSIDPIDRTGGWTANLGVLVGDFNLIGEYLSATDNFDPDSLSYRDQGAKPAAWTIELGYSVEVFGKETVAALAYQGSSEAVNLELPEERWLIGWSIGLFDGTALSFEYAYDTDYSTANGGTGKHANAVVAQLAVEF